MSLLVALFLAIFILPSPWGLVAIAVSAVWEVGEAYFMIRWTQRRRAQHGAEALIGKTARVIVACAPRGQVAVAGERWQAVSDSAAAAGDEVVIRGVEGLTLLVSPSR